MIKVIFGEKGTGKTKILVETANKLAAEKNGDIVFVDDSDKLMYDLKHEIRFINVAQFPVKSAQVFLGFICGIISEDYDIKGIFIDGLTYIVKEKADQLEAFFKSLKEVSEKFNIDFYISINSETKEIPSYMKEYVA
ncbi:MAG: hypothetical protein N2645_14665 [Clostridia bacterium]|nr:hypothetical protein [Clostridia bacterium]